MKLISFYEAGSISALTMHKILKQFSTKYDKITGHNANKVTNEGRLIQFARMTDIDDSITIGELLDKLSNCNAMVKNPNCPHNLKNKFYSYKKKLLKSLYKMFPNEFILTDEGEYFGIAFMGHKYHQLKSNWLGIKDFGMAKKYFHEDINAEFNITKFMDFIFNYYLYFGILDSSLGKNNDQIKNSLIKIMM